MSWFPSLLLSPSCMSDGLPYVAFSGQCSKRAKGKAKRPV